MEIEREEFRLLSVAAFCCCFLRMTRPLGTSASLALRLGQSIFSIASLLFMCLILSSTATLPFGADKGLTAFTIGSIMCRKTLKEESVIEQIVQEAQEVVLPGTSETAFLESVSLIMDRYLDGLSAIS